MDNTSIVHVINSDGSECYASLADIFTAMVASNVSLGAGLFVQGDIGVGGSASSPVAQINANGNIVGKDISNDESNFNNDGSMALKNMHVAVNGDTEVGTLKVDNMPTAAGAPGTTWNNGNVVNIV